MCVTYSPVQGEAGTGGSTLVHRYRITQRNKEVAMTAPCITPESQTGLVKSNTDCIGVSLG